MNITSFKKYYKGNFPVGKGWKSLVENLIDDIIKISKDIEVFQIKEKFGGLRVYIGTAPDEVYNLIDKAENESYKICEFCGSREGVTTEGSWIKTLCKKCRRSYG